MIRWYVRFDVSVDVGDGLNADWTGRSMVDGAIPSQQRQMTGSL